MRIFPFNIKSKTWHNYSNYLNWLSLDILSIQDYLSYFNPDFRIINEDLYGVSSRDWKSTIIRHPSTSNIIGNDLKISVENLLYRQGVKATKEGFYFEIGDTRINLEVSQTVFSMKHAEVHPDSSKDLSSYLVISHPQSGVYTMTSSEDAVKFNYYSSGLRELGMYFPMVFETTPSRYFINPNDAIWKAQSSNFQLQNARLNSEGAIEPLVQNKINQAWTNSYPLMHRCYYIENDHYEDIVFDHGVFTEIREVEKHATVFYNLNAKEPLQNDVYVSII